MKRFFITGALATLVVLPMPGAAEPPQHECSGKCRQQMFADLNLTAEQQQQLKALHDEMKSMREKNMESVKTVRDKMKAELLKADASSNVLYGYAAELGELHKQMSKDRCDHLLKVKKVLTPEQFAKLVEKEDRMGPGRGFGPPPEGGNCPHSDMGCQHKGGGKCPHGSGAEAQPAQHGGPAGCPHHDAAAPKK